MPEVVYFWVYYRIHKSLVSVMLLRLVVVSEVQCQDRPQ